MHVELTHDTVLDMFDLNTPWFQPASYPSWRDNIRAGWVLVGTHYTVQNPRFEQAKTSIAVGLPLDDNEREVSFPLTQFKRIAQAVVHFEDALQMLMPKDRHQRRNWQDNVNLRKVSRSRAITTIEKAADHKKLSALLCPQSGGNYCWEFSQPRAVVFVQPGASQRAADLLRTTERTLTFIEACLDLQSPAQLQNFSPDVNGFSAFLSGSPSQPHPVPRSTDQHRPASSEPAMPPANRPRLLGRRRQVEPSLNAQRRFPMGPFPT
jgi:hypothetical protein